MVIKNTAFYRFLNKFYYLKKFAAVCVTIFFPWIVIYRQKQCLESIGKESFLVSQVESINNLKLGKVYNLLQENSIKAYPALDKIAGMLHWPELLDKVESKNGFGELLRLLALFYDRESKVSNPSNCWVLLAAKNCDQLLKYGYENFKRTIGHNYFNFLVQKGDPQIKAVEGVLPAAIVEYCKGKAQILPRDPSFRVNDPVSYYYFVLLLWEYAKKIDRYSYLDQLEEPKEGNPILVEVEGKSMSQDLANSLIEYYSINDYAPFSKIKNVLEIGDGYGRNAHVILSLNPELRVILVDILPALYLAQRYLSSVFKNRKVFMARDFENYEEVRGEIESASIVFLMPHQLTLLPNDYVDLTMNISSFGEMSVDQIDWYFDQINRLTREYFYTKQWNESKNPFDGLVLKKRDYPYRSHWKEIYSRNCEVQIEFFETLFQVKGLCRPQTV